MHACAKRLNIFFIKLRVYQITAKCVDEDPKNRFIEFEGAGIWNHYCLDNYNRPHYVPLRFAIVMSLLTSVFNVFSSLRKFEF